MSRLTPAHPLADPRDAATLDDVVPSGAGLIFDRYELVRRLAIGGMGEVFVARQVSQVQGFERRVILKSLLPDLAADAAFVDQFLDEARVAATLNHPNVVSVYEVGASGGTYYIAMEFIPGVNLSQLRRQAAASGHPLPPQLAGRIVLEAAAGLHHAHVACDAAGQPLALVHRDVSPHNIMLRADGLTKVVDFGIASAANRVTRTRTGVVKGKLAYMSPEQLRSVPLDGRSDQFSLGIVLWELLTGRRLFTGDDDAELARAVLQAPIASPSSLGAPRALDAVVARMLQRERADRFDSCEQVEQALETWLKGEATPSDHAALAAWLRDAGGTGLDEQSLSTPDDFVIKLRSQGNPVTVELTKTGEVAGRRRRRALLLLALPLLGLAGYGALRASATSADPQPVASPPTSPASPPAPAPAAPASAPAPARLSLSTRPPGARLQLDGVWLEQTTPVTVPVEAGERHLAHVELKGFRRVELALDALDAGVLHAVELSLKPEREAGPRPPPAVPPPPDLQRVARLSVRTVPAGGRVYLDGKFIGSGTVFQYATTAGAHELEVRDEQGKSRKQTVTLKADQTAKLTLKLEP